MTLDQVRELLIQARASEKLGSYRAAEQVAADVLEALDKQSWSSVEAADALLQSIEAQRLLGVVSSRQGDNTKALERLMSALQLSEPLNNKASTAQILDNIGSFYNETSNYPLALEYHAKALGLNEELANKAGVAESLGNIGKVYANQSKYSTAIEYLTKALSLCEEIGNKDLIAVNLGNIGLTYNLCSDYVIALEFLTKALSIDEELGNKADLARHLGNIGAVYFNQTEYAQALEYYRRALRLFEEIGRTTGIATTLSDISLVYQQTAEYSNALEYSNKSLRINEEIGNRKGSAEDLRGIGYIYVRLNEHARSLEYFEQALQLFTELGSTSGIARTVGQIGIVYADISDYSKALLYFERALTLSIEIGNKTGQTVNLCNIGIIHMTLSDYTKALEYLNKSLLIAEAIHHKGMIAKSLGSIGDVYLHQSDFFKALEALTAAYHKQQDLGLKEQASQSLVSIGSVLANLEYSDRDEAQAEVHLLKAIDINKELNIENYRSYKQLSDLYWQQERWKECAHALVTYHKLKDEVQSEEARKSAEQMEQRRVIAEREKEIAIAQAAADAQMSATTSLLYKVLPETVATRMIGGDNEIADYYPQVSILFADIAGFTPLSADMPAIIVVRFLNYVFAEFDRIIKKHGCEKIKTIGDGYMAVCGAPIECSDHAERLAAAAIEMQQTIILPESIREHLPDNTKLGVRIGLHTGSVVAGVIGEERFVYDIYSDAVNIAARMESHGEEDKIHCSNDFYRHMQNRFAMTKNTTHGLSFVKRGEMEIKGKGMMRTYFMEKA